MAHECYGSQRKSTFMGAFVRDNSSWKRQGTLYLEDHSPADALARKKQETSKFIIQTYYGYSFESYCTARERLATPPPSTVYDPNATVSTAAANKSGSQEEFEVPNTNVQWCSVVKTTLGTVRMVIGGEVDCVKPHVKAERVSTNDFVELKTNLVIRNERDEINFERHKLLKHYVQSCESSACVAFFVEAHASWQFCLVFRRSWSGSGRERVS